MIPIDYDTQTYNTVAALQVGVATAQTAYDTAETVSDALAQRLSTFLTELGVAQMRLSTAESDKAAADAAEKSVDGSLLEALKATRQALIIYASARNTLQLAQTAAQQAVVAGYLVSETLSHVTTASNKNSFITRQLLVAAEQAEADASAAVDAAVSALKDATDAFIATERAAGASFLVVASLIDLQSLMSGYTKPKSSNENELPSALGGVKPLSLAGVLLPPARSTPASDRKFDKFLLQQTPALLSSAELLSSDAIGNDVPTSVDLLEFAVDRYMKTTANMKDQKVKDQKDKAQKVKDQKDKAQKVKDQKDKAQKVKDQKDKDQEDDAPTVLAPLPDDSGLQPGFNLVRDIAKDYETEMQDATTLTRQAATDALQDLSRKTAALQTAQNALTAARQAAGA
jgi:hypothetical protein